MLTAYPRSEDAEALTAARKVSWLDLLNPTEEERASVESKYGLKLPSREELSEVELSSRISESDGVLYLSIPTITHVKALDQPPSPVGFVLSRDLLVTTHYTPLRSKRWRRNSPGRMGARVSKRSVHSLMRWSI